MAHVRLDQVEAGLPVLGAQTIVHLMPSGEVASVTDGLVRSINVDTTPSLSSDHALDIAIGAYPGASVEHETELFILRHDGLDHLVYRVEVDDMGGATPSLPSLFIDAHDGEIVFSFDNLHSALDRETYKFVGSHWSDLPGDLKRSEGDAATGDASVDLLHDQMGQIYDYYWGRHTRDSFDYEGATIQSTVDWGGSDPWMAGVRDNAGWDGRKNRFLFGSGYESFSPLSQSPDVVAHEFAHAVTQYSLGTRRVKGLLYQGESGALNESISDIFAALIDAWSNGGTPDADTWRIAEDAATATLGAEQEAEGGLSAVIGERPALRYMNNPPADGHSLDHYSNYRSSVDVHHGSGISNKAFYLMATDSSMTMMEAGDIWYRALRHYMVPRADFLMGRRATIQAAMDLFGQGAAEVTAVADAWTAVGVPKVDAFCEPAATLQGWTEISGDTRDTETSTDNIDFWPSLIAVGNFEGPEVAYAWTPSTSGDAKIKFVNPRPTEVNHDIFLLLDPQGDGSCKGENAVKRGHNDLVYEVEAGQTYMVVIDGYHNDEGAFTLRFEAD